MWGSRWGGSFSWTKGIFSEKAFKAFRAKFRPIVENVSFESGKIRGPCWFSQCYMCVEFPARKQLKVR